MKRALKRLLVWGGAAVAAVSGVALLTNAKPAAPKRPDQSVYGWPGGLSLRDAMRANVQRAQAEWPKVRAEFDRRRKLLPADAAGAQDKYTKQKFMLPAGMGFPWPGNSVDEFGRPAAGLPADFKATLLRVTQQVLPMVPGIGPAASAALAYAIAIGQGKSQKDALVAAARAAVPVQYQIAFDLGVGVASGEPVDKAALNAFFKSNPAGKAYYDTGKAAWSERYEAVKVFP